MLTMVCMRCQAVVPLEVEVDGDSYDQDSPEDIQVDVAAGKGALLAVCAECITPREAWLKMVQGAVRVMDLAEEQMGMLEMVMERIPDAREDPSYKAHYAEAKQHYEQFKAAMEVLLANEPADD
jgi:hypothetical protein